jgi:uncharacterized protein YdeI (YjbR/CyaY-like superfamily)
MGTFMSGEPETLLRFESPEAWEAWLATNHDAEGGVRVAIRKKGGEVPARTYAEAREVALAGGWIDGQKQPLDQDLWLQRFSRRRARSPWSKVNRAKAEELIRAGRMRPPGLAEVERAKRDGRWEAAYDSAKTSEVPEDLAAALEANPRARDFFAKIDAANRYAVLYRVQTAKKPETRQRRIADLVAMLGRHERIHPVRKAKAGK